MKLIVGLGNPGFFYQDSRHNVGFLVVKKLAKHAKVSLKKDRGIASLTAKLNIAGQYLILAMPLTFMNLSGTAVKKLLEKYKISTEDLLVVCDDMDLELGRLKIKPTGSSAGHRGLKSIMDSLGTPDISRLRIGIGRPPKGSDPSEYVLEGFNKKEKGLIKEAVVTAVECCRLWAAKGIVESMNVFN